LQEGQIGSVREARPENAIINHGEVEGRHIVDFVAIAAVDDGAAGDGRRGTGSGGTTVIIIL